ncbi:MAG: DUF2589 domain-containing protein [Saprospiraceae bacterium]|nr:DUF2589 domain-containing protein [Saprospiraceae bacterium]
MSSLKKRLSEDHSKPGKKELLQLLSGIRTLIGDTAYEQIHGLLPEELEDKVHTRKTVQEIVEKFQEAYDPAWEEGLQNLSKDVTQLIFGLAQLDEATFGAMNAANADFAAELGSIDFATLIGGPMEAAVKAQTNASLSTASFIKEVAFETNEEGEGTKLKMVDFSYTRPAPSTGEGETSSGESETVQVTVPFITILSIPSLRIETLDIDFNVKLNSTYTRDVSSQLGIDVGAKGKFGPVKFDVNVSYKRSASTGIKVEKEYSMGVKVRATNDEMPAGLEKVLGLLSA